MSQVMENGLSSYSSLQRMNDGNPSLFQKTWTITIKMAQNLCKPLSFLLLEYATAQRTSEIIILSAIRDPMVYTGDPLLFLVVLSRSSASRMTSTSERLTIPPTPVRTACRFVVLRIPILLLRLFTFCLADRR